MTGYGGDLSIGYLRHTRTVAMAIATVKPTTAAAGMPMKGEVANTHMNITANSFMPTMNRSTRRAF